MLFRSRTDLEKENCAGLVAEALLRYGVEDADRTLVCACDGVIQEGVVARFVDAELEDGAIAGADFKGLDVMKDVGGVSASIDRAEHCADDVEAGGTVRACIDE